MASPLRRPWIPLLLIALLAGCASTQRGQAEKTERQLMAAGFQMRLADTPSKLDRRYERIAMLKRGLDERRDIAEAREDTAMNLGAWGPWGGFW